MAKKPTINMLADIRHYYGKSEGDLIPWIKAVIFIAIPICLYFYFDIRFIPTSVFMLFWVPYSIRMLLKYPGHEKERLEAFKKQNYDEYTQTNELSEIQRFGKDGLISYSNGEYGYAIITSTKTYQSDEEFSKYLADFLNKFEYKFDIDIYCHNINETVDNTERYAKIKNAATDIMAKNILDCIDYQIEITKRSSKVMRIIFIVKARKIKLNELKEIVRRATADPSKYFKSAHVITDQQELCNVMSRDVSTYVDPIKLYLNRFFTGEYYGSTVITVEETKKEISEDTLTGFIEKE